MIEVGLSVLDARNKIQDLEEYIEDVQEKCSHSKEYLVYCHLDLVDPKDDWIKYTWTNFHCHMCQKLWEEDGHVGEDRGISFEDWL